MYTHCERTLGNNEMSGCFHLKYVYENVSINGHRIFVTISHNYFEKKNTLRAVHTIKALNLFNHVRGEGPH